MFLKMMSNQDLADSDDSKDYALIQLSKLETVHFDKVNHPNTVLVTDDAGHTTRYAMRGNCYIMNDSGKTIATKGLLYAS